MNPALGISKNGIANNIYRLSSREIICFSPEEHEDCRDKHADKNNVFDNLKIANISNSVIQDNWTQIRKDCENNDSIYQPDLMADSIPP